MTLSNITSLSAFTDNAPLSPAYFNSKWSEVDANFQTLAASNATDFGITQSGSTYSMPYGTYWVLRSYDSGGFGYNLRAFPPASAGTDWTVSLRSALSVADGGAILVPPGNYYLSSTVTLSRQAKIFGAGGQGTAAFIKTHGGDMFNVTTSNVEMHNIGLEADTTTASAATSGWAVRVTNGTNSANFKFLGGAINSFNSGVRFDDDAGSGSMFDNCRVAGFNNGSTASALALSFGSDTAARQRFFTNVNMPGGSLSIGSVQDLFLTGCQFDHYEVVADAFGVHLADCRYGAGSTSTFNGDTCYAIANSSSGTNVLGSGFDGVFALNVRTQGGLVDNTGASGCLVIDHNLIKFPSTATVRIHSTLSLGVGGSPIAAISSMSSKIAAFVVQGSASSFTIVTWAAALPGDVISATVFPDAAVSSLSSGLVLHSHCTQAGQIEFRLSNVSTLAQNQSSKTYYFLRVSPF